MNLNKQKIFSRIKSSAGFFFRRGFFVIKLSDSFSYKRLIKFTLPSISMSIFTSIYGVVDGFFISNFVGKIEFAALNFIMPFLIILSVVGFLFGTGGAALIAKKLGEGDTDKANKIFSMLIYVSIGLGIFLSAFGIFFIGDFAKFLGAEGELLRQSVLYGKIILLALPAANLQFEFTSLFVAAEKPNLGFQITVLAGLTNIFLDALFIIVLGFGFKGAAAATALSYCVGGFLPVIYFARKNSSLLRLTKFEFDGKALLKTCTNGLSELVTVFSVSFVSVLYNVQLLSYAGENGVAAYGIVMYVSWIFQSILIGYTIGVSPPISFNHGAKNYSELKNLLKKSLTIIAVLSVVMFAGAEIFAETFTKIFVGCDSELTAMTVRAFRLFGFTIFSDAFFTALNNGFISATISFLHTFVFETGCVILIPIIFSISGIWFSIVAAEILSVTVAFGFFVAKRKVYRYW